MAEPSAAAHGTSAPGVREQTLSLGVMVFLASESMLFAGMFALYAAGRLAYPRAFAAGVARNLLWVGTANTYLLLVSSWCIAAAVVQLRRGRRRAALALSGATMLLGIAFLGLKGHEYAHHLAAEEGPGGDAPVGAGGRFFTALYWLMTGAHALHVVAGLALLGWLAWLVGRRRTGAATLELGAWYWHLVDLMWIVLWPLFYLLGRSPA
jgi:cytochrome c oxidase subunit 3